MCPVCLTSLALWSAGATSTGGLGWLLLRRAYHSNKAVPADVLQKNHELPPNAKTESTKEN